MDKRLFASLPPPSQARVPPIFECSHFRRFSQGGQSWFHPLRFRSDSAGPQADVLRVLCVQVSCCYLLSSTRVLVHYAVQATWMAYDMVVMRTNPALADSMRRLEDAFLNCKEEMEKNWQELLNETKPKQ
uniref:Synaptonemal complex central element protein 3 n=1 Tax=Sarcophilus harrisii TaxID=9305 RepID=A0A7N4PEQ7_SARHA